MRRQRRSAAALATVAGLVLSMGACATSKDTRVALKPADVIALKRELARTFIDHGSYDQAVEPLKEILARKPEDAEAHDMLGTIYRQRRLYEAAEREFKRASALDPRAAAPWSDLGITYDLMGRHEDAVAAHRKAVELEPDVGAFRNNLGYSLLLSDKPVEAIAALKEALTADPTSTRARNNLGFAYGRTGNLDAAQREFAQAGAPTEARNNLGLVYERAGNMVHACSLFRESLELDSTNEEARKNARRACGSSLAAAGPVAGSIGDAGTNDTKDAPDAASNGAATPLPSKENGK